MPGKITMAQLDAKAQELGDVGKALAWAKANGYEVDTGTELPPVGGLAAAGGEEPAMGGPDEEDEDLDYGGLAAADGSLDFAKLNDPAVFNNMYASQRRAAAAQEQSAKQLFEQARAKLAERYAGPARSDQLLAISSAMLSPRKVPGFKGFLGRMVDTSLNISQAQRQAEQQREDQLLALQQQYQTGAASRQAAQQNALLGLLKTYGALNKPRDLGTWSENLGRFVPKDRPTVIAVGTTKDGLRSEKLSDGSIKIYNADGTTALYDAGGKLIQPGAQ